MCQNSNDTYVKILSNSNNEDTCFKVEIEDSLLKVFIINKENKIATVQNFKILEPIPEKKINLEEINTIGIVDYLKEYLLTMTKGSHLYKKNIFLIVENNDETFKVIAVEHLPKKDVEIEENETYMRNLN